MHFLTRSTKDWEPPLVGDPRMFTNRTGFDRFIGANGSEMNVLRRVHLELRRMISYAFASAQELGCPIGEVVVVTHHLLNDRLIYGYDPFPRDPNASFAALQRWFRETYGAEEQLQIVIYYPTCTVIRFNQAIVTPLGPGIFYKEDPCELSKLLWPVEKV